LTPHCLSGTRSRIFGAFLPLPTRPDSIATTLVGAFAAAAGAAITGDVGGTLIGGAAGGLIGHGLEDTVLMAGGLTV